MFSSFVCFSVFSNFICTYTSPLSRLLLLPKLLHLQTQLVQPLYIFFPSKHLLLSTQFNTKHCNQFKQNYFHFSILVKQWFTQIFVTFTVFPKVYLRNKTPSLPLEKSFSRFLIKLYLEWTKGTKAQRYIIAMKSLLPLKKVSIVNIEK